MKQSIHTQIDTLSLKIEQGRQLRSLRDHAGWGVLCDLLEAGIQNRMARLLNRECSETETLEIRVEVACLRNIMRTADISDDQMQSWARTVAYLQNRRDMLKSYGLDQKEVPSGQELQVEER